MSAEAIILLVSGVIGLVASLVVTTATTVLYINNSFSKNRQLLYQSIDKLGNAIISKLEYHEKHDDERFGNLAKVDQQTSDRIWHIELRNAGKDKTLPHEYEKN
jgi:hypothetical protein